MSLAPIALFTFKRLDHTRQMIESLKMNHHAIESDLYIFADGPRNDVESKETELVRNYLRTIVGFKKIEIIEREKNFGLAKSIISGVTKLVDEFGKIIVVEDDLVTSPFFITYMNEALEKYADEENIGCISGYVYPLKKEMSDPFFIRGADCWGWATWKRAWELFQSDGQKLLNELESKRLTKHFDFNGSYPYTQMLKNQISGKNNSWAIRWMASLYLKNRLCLYPNKTLVENIGLDGSGTHCGNESPQDQTKERSISDERIILDNVVISESGEGFKRFSEHFKQNVNNRNLLARILGRIKRQFA